MIGLCPERLQGVSANAVRIAAFGVLVVLGGCSGSSMTTQSDMPPENSAPTSLTPRTSSQGEGGDALASKVDEPELRKAIERYRITKKRSESPVDFAGVDLTGDGRPEALVLFTGADWCQKTGCSLVVFQKEQVGYKPVTHITSVHGPVLVGHDSNFGWRDLIVKTGGGGSPSRQARLVFAGKGYPANALLAPDAPRDIVSQSQQILVETATAATPPGGGDGAPASGGTN